MPSGRLPTEGCWVPGRPPHPVPLALTRSTVTFGGGAAAAAAAGRTAAGRTAAAVNAASSLVVNRIVIPLV
ncbi:hypothetical protein GCM10010123_38480 [Pilimelia anulata]|uniref:Uncharacterized protein n=1 Tax=Pilimelia anulata TaxID=53371 RepID=A0A8J3FFH5_9ACTN|nr:hypothetical protein GCM10010123_38480 [Pilimelia anulata]